MTFGSVMSVLGSNQLANLLSFTPGWAERLEPRQGVLRGAKQKAAERNANRGKGLDLVGDPDEGSRLE